MSSYTDLIPGAVRANSQNYIAASAKDAALFPVQYATQTISGSVSLATGSAVVFLYTLTQDVAGTDLALVIPRINLFVGDPTTPAITSLPGGSGVNASQYRITGPINTPYASGGVPAKSNQYMNRVSVLNLSGVTQTITRTIQAFQVVNHSDVGVGVTA